MVKIFSHSVACYFVQMIDDGFLCHIKAFQFHEVHLLIIVLGVCTISVLFRKSFPQRINKMLF